ncbi:hypothetical protein WJX77_006259 [Trebouxia sp. C0004]
MPTLRLPVRAHPDPSQSSPKPQSGPNEAPMRPQSEPIQAFDQNPSHTHTQALIRANSSCGWFYQGLILIRPPGAAHSQRQRPIQLAKLKLSSGSAVRAEFQGYELQGRY